MFSVESITSSVLKDDIAHFIEHIEGNLQKHSPSSHSRTDKECELLESLPGILQMFTTVVQLQFDSGKDCKSSSQKLLHASIKFLKTSCAHGRAQQEVIANREGVFEAIRTIIEQSEDETAKKWSWHLLVNIIVDNVASLIVLWDSLGSYILAKMSETHENSGTNAAVLFNCFRIALESGVEEIPTVEIFRCMIEVLQKNVESAESSRMDFVHLCFEYLITESVKFKEIYSQLDGHDRIWTIFYITDHVKDDREPRVTETVLNSLPGEFNRKSERYLNSRCSEYEEDDAKELMALLRCIVTITGSEKYAKIYNAETSLFINTGALLDTVHRISTQEGSAFSPLGKLEDFSSKSAEAQEAEKEVFFELKTLLVRLMANLCHKNRKNQDLARELKFLLTICGCTTMDARNPMMKEWAIVALKNVLEGNAENQSIIASLVNTGPAANSVLSELTMENGTVRINRNQKP
ncbi:ataxin-10 [Phlebotomus argentipes]|uniref:ataxin-10 n=1 Tax=Phlebotomus argentipes TaxID=94469 RepID=UPI00289348A8|nr:ataxin-10 [Phlebotomus argentipes]